MTNENLSAETLLNGTGISVLDAVRIALNILDARTQSSKISPMEFCHKVIQIGKRYIYRKEMKVIDGLSEYIESKVHLRSDTKKDIRYLSKRLMKTNPQFAKLNFSELSVTECELWLKQTFATPSQFNKGRTILHSLFEFALHREWCDRNPIKLIERKKVVEKEIKPLSLAETDKLIHTAQNGHFKNCLPAVAVLAYAGIRPREVRRMKWSDINLDENSITIRSQCSKTGGIRQVEICPKLRHILKSTKSKEDSKLCIPNWGRKWKLIRDSAGFKGKWAQDVLRHTYASFHAKYFSDLARLQLNMGHRDQNLLLSRYINMSNITRNDAKIFFFS